MRIRTRPCILLVTLAIGFASPATADPGPSTPKTSPPGVKEQEQARKTLRQRHAQEYKGKDAASRKALALALFKISQSSPNEPAVRYAALKEAGDVACAAGDVELAQRATREIGKQFTGINALAEEAAILVRIAKENADAKVCSAAAAALVQTGQASFREDDYETTRAAVAAAARAFPKAGTPDLARNVRPRKEDIKEAQEMFSLRKIADVKQRLAQRPDDSAAHLELGKFQAFIKADWEEGLKHLARSLDTELTSLAELEGKSPATAPEQAKIARRWCAWASKERDKKTQRNIQEHANEWYLKALPLLAPEEKHRAHEDMAAIRQEELARLPASMVLVVDLAGGESDALALARGIAASQSFRGEVAYWNPVRRK